MLQLFEVFIVALQLPLLGELSLHLLSSLLQLGLRLETHDASTPLLLDVLVELGGEVILQSLQLRNVLRVHRRQGHHSGVLLVRESTQSALSVDNSERHAHLAAEGRQPHDQLDGIDVLGDNNELRLLLLNQMSDVSKSVLEDRWGRVASGGFSSGNGFGSSFETLLLGSLRLWLVLLQEGEELSSLILVQSTIKLVDGRRNFQTLEKNFLLSLESHIARPPDESTEIRSFRLKHRCKR